VIDLRKFDISTEVCAEEPIRQLAKAAGWECQEQYQLPSGSRIDFLMTVRGNHNILQFGIECKPKLSKAYQRGLHVTKLASYLEQCADYSRELNIPVFLGPHVNRSNFLPKGGSENISSMDAFNLFGGRFNVGVLHYQHRRSFNNNPEEHVWTLVLRGRRMWKSNAGGPKGYYNRDVMTMCATKGSSKKRVSFLKPIKRVSVSTQKNLKSETWVDDCWASDDWDD
jgi:hypothetical protein